LVALHRFDDVGLAFGRYGTLFNAFDLAAICDPLKARSVGSVMRH